MTAPEAVGAWSDSTSVDSTGACIYPMNQLLLTFEASISAVCDPGDSDCRLIFQSEMVDGIGKLYNRLYVLQKVQKDQRISSSIKRLRQVL